MPAYYARTEQAQVASRRRHAAAALKHQQLNISGTAAPQQLNGSCAAASQQLHKERGVTRDASTLQAAPRALLIHAARELAHQPVGVRP